MILPADPLFDGLPARLLRSGRVVRRITELPAVGIPMPAGLAIVVLNPCPDCGGLADVQDPVMG